MLKEVPIKKLVNVALSLKQLNRLSIFATSKAGKDVRVLSEESPACYSRDDYWTGLNIVLGRDFYQKTFNDNDPVPVADIKTKFTRVATMLFGAYYHELFHVLYTPFNYCASSLKYCNASFRSFAHLVSNVLEDITIEGTGCNRYPYATPYINALATCFSQESQMIDLSEAITKEPNNPSTLLGYLLHFVRGTDLSSLPSYKLFEDNKDFIKWGSYKCINTIDSHLRIRRQIAFALELTKILDMKDPSKDNMENPDMSNIENESSSFNKSSSGKASSVLNPMSNLSDTANNSNHNSSNNTQDTDDDIKVDEKDLKQQKASREEGVDPNGECPTSADLTKAGITMLANDDPISRYSHFADRLDKYYKTTKFMTDYNKIVNDHDTQIRRVVGIIRKMLSQNNSGWNHYKMSGQFDVSTVCKKDNYKFFMKKNAPAPTADLVFEILIDNSGSMHGSKATLAGRALIIFCEALDRLHIPFSVDAFTEANAAITISLKDYSDTYAKTKTNMTLFTQQFDVGKLSTWCGNIDEVNLQYVASELALRKEKDKVLIVISDGATCGSWKDLKKVASTIEQSGITVLGVGIFDSNVSNIYSKNVVLKSREDLEGLGAFLNKYLIGKIFK